MMHYNSFENFKIHYSRGRKLSEYKVVPTYAMDDNMILVREPNIIQLHPDNYFKVLIVLGYGFTEASNIVFEWWSKYIVRVSGYRCADAKRILRSKHAQRQLNAPVHVSFDFGYASAEDFISNRKTLMHSYFEDAIKKASVTYLSENDNIIFRNFLGLPKSASEIMDAQKIKQNFEDTTDALRYWIHALSLQNKKLRGITVIPPVKKFLGYEW